MTVPWHTLLAIDFDAHAARTYSANFPGVKVRCASVADELDRLPYADVVLGGPPCQPHSHAGKRLASADARDCGPDFVAAVRKVRPRHFLMENVPGLISSENGRYWQRLYASMEDAGYVVRHEVQDAVNYGVPQFRNRLWCWGIRRDLYAAGMRHAFPRATHAWPPPTDCMFGAALLPGVTVGQALGLEGYGIMRIRGAGVLARYGPRRAFGCSEPSQTIIGGAGDGGSTGAMYLTRIMGAGSNPKFPGDARTERDITDEPSTSLGTDANNAHPKVHAYRWSDAMLQKHPPASPASPASTILGKYYKGGAEGLLRVDDPKHPINRPDRPAVTQRGGGEGHGPPDHTILLAEPAPLYVRRLLPLECLRLQSGPDAFRWPEKISKTAMYKVIGNGWACGHGAAFSRALRAVDPEAETVIDLFCGGGLGACGWHQRYWQLAAAEVTA